MSSGSSAMIFVPGPPICEHSSQYHEAARAGKGGRASSGEPAAEPLVDLGAPEQVEVTEAVADPGLGLRERERPLGRRVTAEGALERYQAVADRARPEGARQRIARHARGERRREALAQVPDARRARHPEARERRGGRAPTGPPPEPAPAARERRAVMRRPEAAQPARPPAPGVPRGAARLAGTPRDEPAHAVAEDPELVGARRPGIEQRFDEVGEVAPVLGDRAPRVVEQVERREAKVAGKCL